MHHGYIELCVDIKKIMAPWYSAMFSSIIITFNLHGIHLKVSTMELYSITIKEIISTPIIFSPRFYFFNIIIGTICEHTIIEGYPTG